MGSAVGKSSFSRADRAERVDGEGFCSAPHSSVLSLTLPGVLRIALRSSNGGKEDRGRDDRDGRAVATAAALRKDIMLE